MENIQHAVTSVLEDTFLVFPNKKRANMNPPLDMMSPKSLFRWAAKKPANVDTAKHVKMQVTT